MFFIFKKLSNIPINVINHWYSFYNCYLLWFYICYFLATSLLPTYNTYRDLTVCEGIVCHVHIGIYCVDLYIWGTYWICGSGRKEISELIFCNYWHQVSWMKVNIKIVVESINLANLDDKTEPNQQLVCDRLN